MRRARDTRRQAALRAEPLPREKSIAFVDGEMTAYGSRAIEGLGYLRRFREQLETAAG